MYKLLLTVLILLVLSACENEPASERHYAINLNDTVTFRYQQVRINSDEGFTLCFDSISSDSRCPLGVECVWEGNAAAVFSFSDHEKDTSFVLNTNRSEIFPDNIVVQNLIFKLVSVTPYPEFPDKIQKEAYNCSIVVKKRSN
ncbi:hypothetical protein [Saccharicrinis sp. FJH54]|uniref:hypothetical protein n=1 Tax=Saccharicrinis sp. FJH54 TaxID=3344665 RepID=UPI0035D41A9E